MEVPASQSQSIKCDHTEASPFSVCPRCGELVFPPKDIHLSPFAVFGLPIRFHFDLNQLQKSFYKLSRILHPDRFQNSSPELLEAATHWFARLNAALTVLRSPQERAQAIFDAVGFKPAEEKSSLPPSMAEEYFELQERLEAGEGQEDIKTFSKKLQDLQKTNQQALESAFLDWENTGACEEPRQTEAEAALQKAFRVLRQQAYFESMANDLEKKWACK